MEENVKNTGNIKVKEGSRMRLFKYVDDGEEYTDSSYTTGELADALRRNPNMKLAFVSNDGYDEEGRAVYDFFARYDTLYVLVYNGVTSTVLRNYPHGSSEQETPAGTAATCGTE